MEDLPFVNVLVLTDLFIQNFEVFFEKFGENPVVEKLLLNPFETIGKDLDPFFNYYILV